jgi:hypothetical protein
LRQCNQVSQNSELQPVVFFERCCRSSAFALDRGEGLLAQSVFNGIKSWFNRLNITLTDSADRLTDAEILRFCAPD